MVKFLKIWKPKMELGETMKLLWKIWEYIWYYKLYSMYHLLIQVIYTNLHIYSINVKLKIFKWYR